MTDAAHPEAGAVTGAPASDDPISRLSAILEAEEPKEETTDEPENEAPVDDETASDEPAEGEADEPTDEQQDEPETPAIDPPVSWNADDKAMFATLPPEAQRAIADRESQREKFVQSKATEAAEARRAVEATQAQASQLHQNYMQTLAQLLPEVPAQPDTSLLRQGEEGAALFYEQQAYREAVIAQHQQVQHLMTQAGQAQAEQDARARAAYDAEQHRLLSDPENGIPGWSEPETRAALAKDITAAAEALGYTPERLADVDATDVKALYAVSQMKAKADKWDALQKQKMATVRAAKDLPKVAKPNAAQPAGSAQAREYQNQRARLRQSGDVRDAAALLRNFV